ncbi:hypothetical protein FHL15_004282 [Xylaria flabelliformis]|uniref:Uncharacterized protein n=1 Tax=Xylaria flabelliformis TaxID=2512241 RepID=A0A553I3P7_9PEZI|nr:hypothetical protein FHL15_004282 [Xylaria flabelliformis]
MFPESTSFMQVNPGMSGTKCWDRHDMGIGTPRIALELENDLPYAPTKDQHYTLGSNLGHPNDLLSVLPSR